MTSSLIGTAILKIVQPFDHRDKQRLWPGANESGKNEVIVRILQLLATLVEYGYYDDPEDIHSVLPFLFKIIQGDKDYLRTQEEDEKGGSKKDGKMSVQEQLKEATAKKTSQAITEEENEAFKAGGRYAFKEEYHYYYETKHQ